MEPLTGKILKGTVVEIQEDFLMNRLRVDIGGDEIITVMVTDAALKELDARVGDELEVITDSGFPATRQLH